MGVLASRGPGVMSHNMTVTNPASSHSASLVVPASLGTRDFEDRARELQESVAPDLYTPNV